MSPAPSWGRCAKPPNNPRQTVPANQICWSSSGDISPDRADVDGRRFRDADLGVPGKHNDTRTSPVAIKMQRHLGIPTHKIQAFGMRLVINQKIGCGLIPQKPDWCRLRRAVYIHSGEPHEILFMHATPHIRPKERAVVWKLKSHPPKSFPRSLLLCPMAQERTSCWEQFQHLFWRSSPHLQGRNN